MRYLLCIILLGPFLVCNPQAGVESYQITGLTGITTVQAQPDGSIKADLATLPAGTYTVKLRACKPGGEVDWCSPESNPFDFTKPVLAAPSGPKLVK